MSLSEKMRPQKAELCIDRSFQSDCHTFIPREQKTPFCGEGHLEGFQLPGQTLHLRNWVPPAVVEKPLLREPRSKSVLS